MGATVPMAATTASQRAIAAPIPPPGRYPTGSSPAANYYEPPPSRTGWYALAAFFALIALGIGAVLLFNALSGDDAAGSNALPDYVGMTLEAAIADLEDRGLSFQSIPEENSTVAEDIIHRTDPVAGTIVVDNQVITLFFNPRKELQEVPNVEGQPLEDAQRILSAAGFQIGETTYEESENIAENSVIGTDPPAGEQVEQATTINLIVSSGRDQQAVPQIVIGRTEADARQLLENPPYSFVVSTVTEETNDVAAGLVIRTEPAVGTLVDIGGPVTLVVSSGAPTVEVPNIVGETEGTARTRLSDFDVIVVVQDLPAGDGNDGRVLAQSVAAGQRAPVGSQIQLTIGRAAAAPPPTTAAPTTAAPTTAAPTTAAPTTDGRALAGPSGLGTIVRSMTVCRASRPSSGSPVGCCSATSCGKPASACSAR